MKKGIIVAAAMMVTVSTQAQTKRTDDFHARYQLKEVVVMIRHTGMLMTSGQETVNSLISNMSLDDLIELGGSDAVLGDEVIIR